MMFASREAPKEYILERHVKLEDEYSGDVDHNLQRKSYLLECGPINHGKNVFYVKDENFDLNKTIFKGVSGMLGFKRMELRSKLGNEFKWAPKTCEEIEEKFEDFKKTKIEVVTKQPSWNNYSDIIRFMKEDCDFNTEHADGSFMDHLYFCRDYSKAHYSSVSPRILFLHSILGVGTNLFPMTVEQIPTLKAMLEPDEFKQIAVFPSLLRLMNQGTLFKQLLDAFQNNTLDSLESIKMFRVIDNEEITLTSEELKVALNIQLIHQLDFLPCSNWCSQVSDPMFQVFVEIYQFLTETKLIEAEVKFDVETLENASEKDEFGMPVTVATVISKYVPKSIKRQALKKSSEAFSKDIEHNMSYTLQWKPKE